MGKTYNLEPYGVLLKPSSQPNVPQVKSYAVDCLYETVSIQHLWKQTQSPKVGKLQFGNPSSTPQQGLKAGDQ